MRPAFLPCLARCSIRAIPDSRPLVDHVSIRITEGSDHDHDEINECPDPEATKREQLKNSSANLAGVKTVYAKEAEEEAQQRRRKNALLRETVRLLGRTATWTRMRALVHLPTAGTTKNHVSVDSRIHKTGIPSVIIVSKQ
jgi:MarR-like DNA-binding transcriptional regulator SgrR of sgrS sRNA